MSDEQDDTEGEATAATWQEIEKESMMLRLLFERLPYAFRVDAAIKLAGEVAVWGGDSLTEFIGILEVAKAETYRTWCEEQAKKDEGLEEGGG